MMANSGASKQLQFSYHNHRWWYSMKVRLLYALLINDLLVNSMADHDDFEKIVVDNTLDYFLLVNQVIGLILIFLVFFLMLLPTYLFRVGLLGVLASHFKFVLYLHPIYFVLTLMSAAYRLVWLLEPDCVRPECLVDMWAQVGFTELNTIHKMVSALYYVANIRATIKLSHPRFYRKQHWVELYYNKYISKSSGSTALSSVGQDDEWQDGYIGETIPVSQQLASVFRNTFGSR